MNLQTENIFLSPDSKIQKYSPTESAKVYDKAVNRKNNVHFHPRQTLDFISNNMAHATLTNEVKKRVVRQYLDVSKEAVSVPGLLPWFSTQLSNHLLACIVFATNSPSFSAVVNLQWQALGQAKKHSALPASVAMSLEFFCI